MIKLLLKKPFGHFNKPQSLFGLQASRTGKGALHMVNVDKKIDSYIMRQKSPQKEICQSLREIIHRAYPEANEEMKWGVPAFGGGKFYIVALRDHVNFGFSLEGLSVEEMKFFDGCGKTMAHIEFAESREISEERIFRLMKLVQSKENDFSETDISV
jgi:hypothetical protein